MGGWENDETVEEAAAREAVEEAGVRGELMMRVQNEQLRAENEQMKTQVRTQGDQMSDSTGLSDVWSSNVDAIT